MEWRQAVAESKKGMAVTMTEDGALWTVDEAGRVRIPNTATDGMMVDETLGGAMDWCPLGERADPLSRVKKGSAIEFVCEMGSRLESVIGDRVNIKRERLYALEMLVATAIVQFRNITIMDSVPMDDDARGVFARDCATEFLSEAVRYYDGAEAKAAPVFERSPMPGGMAKER